MHRISIWWFFAASTGRSAAASTVKHGLAGVAILCICTRQKCCPLLRMLHPLYLLSYARLHLWVYIWELSMAENIWRPWCGDGGWVVCTCV